MRRLSDAYYLWGWRCVTWLERVPLLMAALDLAVLVILAICLIVIGICEFLIVVIYHHPFVPVFGIGGGS